MPRLLLLCCWWLVVCYGVHIHQDDEHEHEHDKTDMDDDVVIIETVWTEFLKDKVHVKLIDGIENHVMDYHQLYLHGDARLKLLLERLDKVNETKLDDHQRIALHLNAYNIFAVHLVASHFCTNNNSNSCVAITAITDIGNASVAVWDIKVGSLGGTLVSLNEIEDLVRKLDPRGHAAVNTASASCPDLRTEAYTGSLLDVQLNDQFRRWLHNDKKGFALDRTNMTVSLNPIFLWFAPDFINAKGSVQSFVSQYLQPADAEFWSKNEQQIKVNYFDYDWHVTQQ